MSVLLPSMLYNGWKRNLDMTDDEKDEMFACSFNAWKDFVENP